MLCPGILSTSKKTKLLGVSGYLEDYGHFFAYNVRTLRSGQVVG